ncbi:MAG: nitrite/sulfite reductase, partial [Alphaproteobacteria bacterium]|nr:nitrite/sulfite reductase [Alphaproteobacteria bacterium]
MTHVKPIRPSEPLVSPQDLIEFQAGLDEHRAGALVGDRWTGFRVRHGVYGQRQTGMHMMRLKIPGGIVTPAWLRVVAAANRVSGDAAVRITTRQDLQLYSVPLDKTTAVLKVLHEGGVPTREAGGNTLRNATACAFSGACPAERVDAGRVAQRLTSLWLRHPLGQNMPRKIKISVSGCASDCALGMYQDIALVAVERDGVPGFRVIGAGGLGAQPMPGIELLPFVEEHELGAVIEAVMRVHHAHSDRRNRNGSRLKFLVRRMGADEVRRLVGEAFQAARPLPQRPWQPLDWRRPDGEGPPVAGRFEQPDGKIGLVAAPPLGLLGSDQLDALAGLVERAGIPELRLLMTQRLFFPGLSPQAADILAAALTKLGLSVADQDGAPADVVSCTGTAECPIGITNSRALASEIVAQGAAGPYKVRVSGCHNSCGQHHLGDIGLHGMAKRTDGRAGPRYQIHVGGDARLPDGLAIAGPVVNARQATLAVSLVAKAISETLREGESVRDWALRQGEAGLDRILAPALDVPVGEDDFVDVGDVLAFAPPAQTKGDCAAPFNSDAFLADLSKDSVELVERGLQAGLTGEALRAAGRVVALAGRRLLARQG